MDRVVAIRVTEQQRQKYLDAMGVQPWFSRYRFPAAPIAKACFWPEALDPLSIPSQSTSSSAIAAPQNAGVSSLKSILGAPAETVRPAAHSPAKVGSSEEASSQTSKPAPEGELPSPTASIVSRVEGPMPRARIFVVPVGEVGLVVGELPFLGEPFSRFHLELLTDLLRSCKWLPVQPLTAHQFQWPVCETLVAPYGLAGGIEALQGFLRNQHALDRREWLLLLGTQAAQLTKGCAQSFDQLRGLSEFEGKHCLVTHGLTQLMRLPPLKLETWQDLQRFMETTPRS